MAVQGKIGYVGPLQRGGAAPRVKLDLTADEILVLDKCTREVSHPYSDRPDEGIYIGCYCYEEIFAEKLRALAERLKPRDLYDVIHLYRRDDARQGRASILTTLNAKCRFKGISLPTAESLERMPERGELVSEWENMLAHQVPILPPLEQFWEKIPEVFSWLYRSIIAAAPPPIPTMDQAIDTSWQPPPATRSWDITQPLDAVRYAASNRLCVELSYQGSKRLIEPYSLRRTREGHVLLYAVKHDTGEIRSYRIDRIAGAKATQMPFTPRFAIELTSTDLVSVPLKGPSQRRSSFSPRRMITTYGRHSSHAHTYGLRYIFECVSCGKKFTHKSYDSSLGPHKDKQGYPCPSRIGYYVTTKYS
jgi:hypothetical protein